MVGQTQADITLAPPGRDALVREIERLRAYEKALVDADRHDDERFTQLLREGFALLDLLPADLVRGVGAHRGSVSRWYHGHTAPKPIARPYIYDWLRNRALTKRRQLMRRLSQDQD